MENQSCFHFGNNCRRREKLQYYFLQKLKNRNSINDEINKGNGTTGKHIRISTRQSS